MKRTFPAFLVIVLMVLGSGCQDFDGAPISPGSIPDNQADTEIDLDSPSGGFSDSDEEPAFGEPELFEPMMHEIEAEDAYQEQRQFREKIREMECRKGARVYRARFIWGHLPNAYIDNTATDCCGVDWDGSLHLEGGIIIIERIIAFEPNDSLIRIDKSTISWVSHTCPHVDGIQVKLVIPPSTDRISKEIYPSLTIETEPFNRTFSLDELEALHMVESTDTCGNGIAITSHTMHPYCPHGHLFGRWRNIPPDTIAPDSTDAELDSTKAEKVILGEFRGIWISKHGFRAGYLKGVYGTNSAGERVFFGKYIDMYGKFKGILKGKYGPTPVTTINSAHPHGWFEGIWVSRNGIVEGRLKGHWTSRKSRRPGHGSFHGVWGMNCSNKL